MWQFTAKKEAYRSVQAVCWADQLYRRARTRARWGRVWSMLTGRCHSLLDLSAVEASCRVRSRCWAGRRTVAIRHIRGSEGRCQDFDLDFHPLQGHTRERWVGIAAAWELGAGLPPVELIQIGDLYFVRDGHHRISAAQAMGQEQIEAQVTVWEVVGPLPWEKPEVLDLRLPIGNLAGQPA